MFSATIPQWVKGIASIFMK
jgi:ATP-dependent RNA helicase DDX21